MVASIDFMAQQAQQQAANPPPPGLTAFQDPFQGLGGVTDPAQQSVMTPQPPGAVPVPPPDPGMSAPAGAPAAPDAAGPPAPVQQTAGPSMQSPETAPGAYSVQGGMGPTRMPVEQALGMIQQYENASGDPTAKNYMYDPTHTASGNYQITNSTWARYAPQVSGAAGYTAAGDAPPEIQKAVATAIYNHEGFGAWAPYNPRLAKAIGWQGGFGADPSGSFGTLEGLAASSQAEYARLRQQSEAVAAEEKRQTDIAVRKEQEEEALAYADKMQQAKYREQQAYQLLSDDEKMMQFAKQTPTRQAAYASVMHLTPLLSILTAIGGKATGVSAMGMLGATAGIVQGVNAGAENKFNDAVDKWKAQYESFKQHMQDMQSVYAGLVEAYGTRADAHEKSIEHTRNILQDQLKPDQAALGNSFKMFTAQTQLAGQLAKAAAVLDKIQGANVPPNVVDFYARQQIAGDTSWRTGLSRTSEGVNIIRAVDMRVPELAKIYGLTPEQAATQKDVRKAIGATLTRRMEFVGAQQQYLMQFQSQMDIVEKYLQPGVGGAPPIFNRWIQNGRQDLGDPDIVAFQNALIGLSREHARIMNGVTSNAMLTDAARRTSDELVNKDMTAGQIRASMRVMKDEVDAGFKAGNEEVALLRAQLGTIGLGAFETGPTGTTQSVPSAQAGTTAAAPVQDKNGTFQPNPDGTYTNTETGTRWQYKNGQWSKITVQ